MTMFQHLTLLHGKELSADQLCLRDAYLLTPAKALLHDTCLLAAPGTLLAKQLYSDLSL